MTDKAEAASSIRTIFLFMRKPPPAINASVSGGRSRSRCWCGRRRFRGVLRRVPVRLMATFADLVDFVTRLEQRQCILLVDRVQRRLQRVLERSRELRKAGRVLVDQRANLVGRQLDAR